MTSLGKQKSESKGGYSVTFECGFPFPDRLIYNTVETQIFKPDGRHVQEIQEIRPVNFLLLTYIYYQTLRDVRHVWIQKRAG